MDKAYATSLFIFRRDLRLADNLGLNAALQQSGKVLACFILDPAQVQPHPYRSGPGLQFMLQSLLDLQRQLARQGGQLQVYQGSPADVIRQLRQRWQIQAVFVNRDYTPFSRRRDAEIAQTCVETGLAFHSYDDALLNPPESILKADGQPYQVFTAFYKRSLQQAVALPQAPSAGEFLLDRNNSASNSIAALQTRQTLPYPAGRQAALALLQNLSHCKDYGRLRDFPAEAATGQLSAHLKFGCCSVREAYYAVTEQFGPDHPMLRQFYWRDFFTHIGFHFPHVFGQAFHRRYDGLTWRKDMGAFQAWAEGRTGFPIVDAGMRQLRQTGLMHNRVRMIAASFLVKDLHISWRWGERYFAQHLLDYDPCLNNGNWQWAASTGCDAQPYFRIFNPWVQQQKFDPDCLYIKQWLPELQAHEPADIHNWHKKPQPGDYPPPMLDHAASSAEAKRMFQQAAQTAEAET